MFTRRCGQCGAVFTPRREHARFCSADCRVSWNRDHLTDAVAEERALEWSLTGMRDVISRLALERPQGTAASFSVVAEAVWWVTIIDARMIRQYMDVYDAVLAAHAPAQRSIVEGTLAGLRFVRNQLGEDPEREGFIDPPATVSRLGATTAAWRWRHRPAPDLAARPAHVQPWEMTRYQAYERWLAGNSVSLVFHRAADFLNLAASRATASQLTSLR